MFDVSDECAPSSQLQKTGAPTSLIGNASITPSNVAECIRARKNRNAG